MGVAGSEFSANSLRGKIQIYLFNDFCDRSCCGLFLQIEAHLFNKELCLFRLSSLTWEEDAIVQAWGSGACSCPILAYVFGSWSHHGALPSKPKEDEEMR